MEIKEIEVSKLKELKEKSKMLIFVKSIQFMDNVFFKDILSFDGKVDKGSARKKGYIIEETKPLNVLNVYSNKLQMCIDQEMIEEKTNEITAIPLVKKTIEKSDGTKVEEKRYYISSLLLNINLFSYAS